MTFFRALPYTGTDMRLAPGVMVPWDRDHRPVDLTLDEEIRRAKFNRSTVTDAVIREYHDRKIAGLMAEKRRGPTRLQFRLATRNNPVKRNQVAEWFWRRYPYMRGWL